MASRIRRMKIKVCVVGDRAVGKTSLIHRYVYNTFSEVYRGTLGAKLHLSAVTMRVAAEELVEANVALFDYMGESAMRDAFRDALFWGAHGFLAVADITRPGTLESLPAWINAVVAVAGDVPYAVVLNKVDLVDEATVGPAQTEWILARLPGTPVLLTSAKTGTGVDKAVERILTLAVRSILETSRARTALQLVGQRILLFAQRRGATGVSQRELIAAIRGLDPKTLEEQVHDLERLGLVAVDLLGPGNFRLRITPKGEEAATDLARRDLVVEEPT